MASPRSVEIAIGGKLSLLLVDVGAVGADHTFRIAHHHVLLAHAETDVMMGAADCGRSGAIHHKLDILKLLALDLNGVGKRGCGDDGSAMLVVVHHGNVALRLETALDLEAFGSLDILEVDSAEGRSNGLDHLHHLVGIGFVDFDIE